MVYLMAQPVIHSNTDDVSVCISDSQNYRYAVKETASWFRKEGRHSYF
jgi:hypothetical protein